MFLRLWDVNDGSGKMKAYSDMINTVFFLSSGVV